MTQTVLLRLAHKGRSLLRRLRKDRRGNVMMVLGFAMIPMTFGVGFGVDYTRAMKLKTRMDAAADAAALAAVNVTAMQKDDATAKEAARKMFNAQVAGLQGLLYTSGATNPDIVITSDGGVNSGRTVTVSYTARSENIFSGVLGSPTLPVEGSATATATRAPHIDFYLLMDTSPSMLLPTTQTGIDALVKATKHSQAKSGGCAFACHIQNPDWNDVIVRGEFDDNNSGNNKWLDKSGNTCTLASGGYVTPSNYTVKVTCSNGTKYVARDGMFENTIWVDNGGSFCSVKEYKNTTVTCQNGTTKFNTANGQRADTYWLVRNYNAVYSQNPSIRLRIDDEQAAAQQLIPFANTTANNNKVTYRLQLFSFDFTPEGGNTPVRTITNALDDVKNMTSYTIPDFYAVQTNWWQQSCPTASYCINDMGTEAHNALVRMNQIITPAGTVGDGSTTANPQKVLFIITDGVVDENQSGRRHREWSDGVNIADCTAIKNRGIRIAILYTEYSSAALNGDSWSVSNVQPHLSKVPGQLQKCASTRLDGTPLFYQVSTDESIPQALSTLFALTVQTARLTK